MIEVREAEGRKITTIEGITDPVAMVVQKVWRDLDVVECGYCQSGQIMQAIGLLRDKPRPTDDDIETFMDGNVCRCATYRRIRAAIKKAAEEIGDV
jgi:isoquinoline 1-oxidoreductase alpha subunit